MSKITRNLIEYNIDNCSQIDASNFKQTNMDFIFEIPYQKPDAKSISKVWIEAVILNKQIAKTPIGTSLEGQIITGYGVLIEGELKVNIEYVANGDFQSSHTAHNDIPFSGYVVLPKRFNINSFLTETIFIEDINTSLISEKCIYNNVTLMFVVDIC